MEIKEIVSYSVLESANILEVAFRTIEDSEEEIRNVQIEYSDAKDYGYELETESFDFFFDDEDEEIGIEEDEDKIELDEEELSSFLNEYFMVNPDRLPHSTIF